MPNYSKSCIYMIKKQDDFNNENIYIGSTCNFTRRKHKHKTTCNNENDKDYNLKLYQYIRENDGWDAWVMTKIIDYHCNNKSELNIMERNYIDSYKSTLNCQIPTRTRKERYNDNKDKILKQQKQYKNDNKEKLSKYKKEHYEANKDKILEKVICDNCGCESSKWNLERHKKSQKCLNFNSK